MSARIVLRKRFRFDARVRDKNDELTDIPVRRILLERNAVQDKSGRIGDFDVQDPLTAAIRRSAMISPHLLENELQTFSEKAEHLQIVPDRQANSEAQESAETGQHAVPEFLTTWGMVLRENPRETGALNEQTGETTYNWLPGRDPDTVRQSLLNPADTLTEITNGAGSGELPTQEGFSDQERRSVAIDSPITQARDRTHWGLRKSGKPTFGQARNAMSLVGTNWAEQDFSIQEDRDGCDINVVIVDTGFSETYLRSLVPDMAMGGGLVDRNPLRRDPGEFRAGFQSLPTGHGNMIARNILRIAPRVRLFDAPILPPRVTDVSEFTYTVEQVYEGIREGRNTSPYKDQPWIIVNAWAVADNVQERGLGPLNMLFATGEFHNTNTLVELMSEEFAIIFAAGNNGVFEPSQGAGLYNRGPHRAGGNPPIEGGRPFGSIAGANAVPGVLTVGACTVNGEWIGASSQGDAPQSLRTLGGAQPGYKPDLVAPSWFSENANAHLTNTGTSAACAVAAGVAAAAWTADPGRSPQDLLDELKQAARNPTNDKTHGFRARFGHGVLQYPDQANMA